ncbi:MBL fold metallo-hydrolase [Terrabacter aerolatus]|uniref:MBL fold hydrolase n=1 Tax=Terrabacter aerolatus TaxID=422442 RepID=A0A512D2N3_9MICO|nr:MBL fold metallo-hydrolase [Terrabacter aerolatus]GEO30732.1 MBL fold hydrolase [Terrabacter aerolatus]
MATVPTAIHVEVLPARLGDCLLVECPRPGGPTWRMVVDGGPPDTWPLLEARLRRLDPADRHIDVVVVTHVDNDHIGGMIPFLSSDLAADVGDFWFNGRTHLSPSAPGATRSIEQGESLVTALLGPLGTAKSGRPGAQTPNHPLPWNTAFGGGPVEAAPAGAPSGGPTTVTVPDGPTLTVLSPTPAGLAKLAATWTSTLHAALQPRDRGLTPPVDVLGPLDDLPHLAGERTPTDSSVPNGSSIALLLEHRGASIVLGADAYGDVLAAGLHGVARARGQQSLPVDAIKLPHHGSQANVVAALLAAAPAGHYLVSTNGDVFHHPDDPAIARVVLDAPAGPTLCFNYRTARTARWADPGLVRAHGHRVVFPQPDRADSGVVVDLPARA